jgi:hypothetical protein
MPKKATRMLSMLPAEGVGVGLGTGEGDGGGAWAGAVTGGGAGVVTTTGVGCEGASSVNVWQPIAASVPAVITTNVLFKLMPIVPLGIEKA